MKVLADRQTPPHHGENEEQNVLVGEGLIGQLGQIVRNHKLEIMFKAFEIAGYDQAEVKNRFGGMVNAFQYGAPPHGGCAAGIDRIVMLLADQQNIREVIMFPMNQRAEDLMMEAPSDPLPDQLMELNLRIIPQE